MLKILACILVYIGVVGFWGWVTYISVKGNLHKKSKYFFIGLMLYWLGLVFNIVYTGIMGWNYTPTSDLESLLDSVTFVIQMIGVVLMYMGVYKIFKTK